MRVFLTLSHTVRLGMAVYVYVVYVCCAVDRMLEKDDIKVVVYSGQLDLIVDTLGKFISRYSLIT